jgi:hypothetical protein
MTEEVRIGEQVGKSAAPDVSVVTERIAALDRHLTAEIQALRRETLASSKTAERAVEVAAQEATERLTAHNGLIEQMRQQAAQFATRESLDDFKEANNTRLSKIERFQAMLVGGILLLSAIGVANLVKVWS